MFKNKNEDGTLNVCGSIISKYRLENKLSQRQLAEQMQLSNIDINKNAIQQIEIGRRFVTDIELVAFARYFNISADELLNLGNDV